MKKIIVTGSNGQLGRAVRQEYAKKEEYELVLTDVAELDITDIKAVTAFVEKIEPYAIINCAAHTNVDLCETDCDNAFKINAIGPRNLSVAANKTGAKLVQVSTDYVFAGTSQKPYTEFDQVNPQGMYGLTKLAGENFVKEFAGRYFIIRTAWLYGDGKNFVKTMLKLSEDRDTVKVVKDQFGSPTSAKELARLIVCLLETENYGLFHGTCEGSCSWADFAEEIFRLAGKSTRVERIASEEFPSPVKRPAYSVLDNYMLRLTTDFVFADWKEAVREYIKSLQEQSETE